MSSDAPAPGPAPATSDAVAEPTTDGASTLALTGISSMATRLLLAELAPAWRAHGGGGAIGFEAVGGVEAAQRVAEGAAYDVVVLALDALERLEAQRHLVSGSIVALVRSEVAIAVPRGQPRPRVESEVALTATLRAAARIGYSTGPSGQALLRLIDRLGLADALAGRLVQAPPGVPVGDLLARGEATLGFQQLSELIHHGGIEVVGPMPPGCAIETVFAGAIGARSAAPRAAAALLQFLRGPSCDGPKRRHGLAPA